MIILSLRTDQETSEIGLWDGRSPLAAIQWVAHRELATTLFHKIDELLHQADKALRDVGGLVVFEGPGSFTGLRIGITAANTIAYSLGLPIVTTRGEEWVGQGVDELLAGKNDWVSLPFYGSDAHITAQKK